MKERQAGRFSVFFVVLAVCLAYALGGGIRSNYGLMRSAIAGASGVDYAGISFVLAAAQLAFGVMQPVFGALALKTSNVFVLLLSLAFFTCGFHVAIIETHLYTQFTGYGFSEQSVTYAFSIYGIATMAGSVVSGYLGSRFSMKTVLGCFYAFRTLWIVGFLLLPKSPASMYLFAILLGFTGMATVPPTSGLIGRRFGPAALGTLFGVAFLFHQMGSFVSAWVGGLTVTATGGYTLIWCIDAALCLAATACAFRVTMPTGVKTEE